MAELFDRLTATATVAGAYFALAIGVLMLGIALHPARRVMLELSPGRLRAGWGLMFGMILLFIAGYLAERSHFGFTDSDWQALFLSDNPLNVADLIQRLLAAVDWAQLAGGLAVAALFVFAASEYRRRVVVA